MAKRTRGPRRMTTIQDIATDLGLSAMTISRALNGHPDVKEETRKRIEKRARELNYRPNRWARSLVTRRSQIIGVVIPDFSHTFFAEIVSGIQEAVERRGYTLILCNSAADSVREAREINMLIGSRADGLIVASSFETGNSSFFQGLLEEGVPFVLIDRNFDDMRRPFVGVDDEAAGRLAAEHLLELGHRRLALIAGPHLSTAERRARGFLKAVEGAGVIVGGDLIAGDSFSFEGGEAAMKGLLQHDPRPTAVFAANDPAAMGAIRACREAGVRVPDDISIMGAGGVEFDYLPEPFLTTTDWSRREIGQRAGEMLLSVIEERDASPAAIALPPRLVVRRSTAPPSASC